jgi:hypothetical protein
MRASIVWILAIVVILYVALTKSSVRERFKNIDNDAANELAKINQKILPYRAICIRGAQCISGKCLEANNEATYGYCAEPLPSPTA